MTDRDVGLPPVVDNMATITNTTTVGKSNILKYYKIRKFSIKGTSPYKGASCFPDTKSLGSWTFLAISQPKIV